MGGRKGPCVNAPINHNRRLFLCKAASTAVTTRRTAYPPQPPRPTMAMATHQCQPNAAIAPRKMISISASPRRQAPMSEMACFRGRKRPEDFECVFQSLMDRIYHLLYVCKSTTCLSLTHNTLPPPPSQHTLIPPPPLSPSQHNTHTLSRTHLQDPSAPPTAASAATTAPRPTPSTTGATDAGG